MFTHPHSFPPPLTHQSPPILTQQSNSNFSVIIKPLIIKDALFNTYV